MVSQIMYHFVLDSFPKHDNDDFDDDDDEEEEEEEEENNHCHISESHTSPLALLRHGCLPTNTNAVASFDIKTNIKIYSLEGFGFVT